MMFFKNWEVENAGFFYRYIKKHVIPAEAGIQAQYTLHKKILKTVITLRYITNIPNPSPFFWIPASAGMTC